MEFYIYMKHYSNMKKKKKKKKKKDLIDINI